MNVGITKKISPIRTVGTFLKGRACSDTLFNVLNHAYGQPLAKEERAAMPLAGGIMQHGFQCGMIWGATLAAGARAYRLFGPGTRAEIKAITAAQRLVASFRARHQTIDCLDITGMDKSASTMDLMAYFLFKGGSMGCMRMAAGYAPVAYKEIDVAFSANHHPISNAPTSCAAVLARKMGVSGMHRVMAAGLAGGIGLSGGGCGALGAAIWIIGMNRIQHGDGKTDFKDPRATDAVDRFLKCSGYQFECAEIVGRKFENVAEHAEYLRLGGCADLIEALASNDGKEGPNIDPYAREVARCA